MEYCDESRPHLPGEIVEVYRQPGPDEVVLTYVRTLPGTHPAAAAPPAAPVKKRRRRRRKGLWIFLACFAAAALLAVGSRVWDNLRPRPARDTFEQYFEDAWEPDASAEISIPTAPTGQGAALEVLREHGEPLTPQEIYRQVNPSVVTVAARMGENASMGTGVIFTADGYILTNHHVLAGGTDCMVILDTGYSYEAKYVAGDADTDLAVLKVEGEDFPAAAFGDSDQLMVGDPAYAIGNPLNYELLGTMTDGIISAVNREVWVDGRTMTLLQTNAALNSGNSGGPLINQYGQVVGINVIKMSSAYDSIEGLGFAIPTAIMERTVNDLLTWGEPQPEPLLGVSVLQKAEEVEEGVFGLRVDEVTPDGAAGLAGVRVGDYVVFADGELLMTSEDLLRIRRRHYVGGDLRLTLWRDGEIIEIVLHLKDAVEETETPDWYEE